MKRLIFLPFIILLFIADVNAQDVKDLDVTLEIRPRTEFRNGAFTLRSADDDPAFFISQRSRLSLNYNITKLSFGLGLQNVRVWGASPQVTVSEGSNTMIHEAWAAYQVSDDFGIKAGRQSLIYDDDRILGSLNWHQAGRWHDVLLLKYEPKDWQFHMAAGYNQDTERVLNNYYSSPRGNYKSLQMLWIGNNISDNYNFSLLFLNTGFEDQADSAQNFLQTFGGNFYRVNSNVNFTSTFYYQTGTNAAGTSVSAYLASLYGSILASDRISILAGTDYLSGEDMNTPDDTFSAFNPLYGTHHKFYGYMDYFYVGVPHNNVGLWDKYAGVLAKLSDSFSLQLMSHFFNSTGDVYKAEQSDELESYLGTELDLTFGWVINPILKINGGYSQMFATESMEVIKQGGDNEKLQNWIWLMVTASPKIF